MLSVITITICATLNAHNNLSKRHRNLEIEEKSLDTASYTGLLNN